jgi:hypothetical protein
MEQGANTAGLEPSTYEATLDFYLNSDYPLGGLVPLGIAGQLVGQDYVWVWQPHLSVLAAMLGLALYVALDGLGLKRPMRAGLAFVAAQPALVLGFGLWGGFKEVGAAWLLVLVCLLAVRAVAGGQAGRRLLPLAVACAAVLAVLSLGGAVWLAPPWRSPWWPPFAHGAGASPRGRAPGSPAGSRCSAFPPS